MFESIMNFFKKLRKTENKETKSKDTAKERLHLVLMQDRANVSADFLEMMKQEIIEVIKKYIEIDEKEIDVRLTNEVKEDGTTGAPSLYANIPIVNIRTEMKKDIEEKNKSDNKENSETKEKEVKTENKDNEENTKKEEDNKKSETETDKKENKEEVSEEKKEVKEEKTKNEKKRGVKEKGKTKEKVEEAKKEEKEKTKIEENNDNKSGE